MTLIKSISGIRGTIGGKEDEGLTPPDVVKYSAAFAQWVKENSKNNKIVVGRDARISGRMVSDLVCATLCGMGIEVIDLGLSTTPTVEMAVTGEKAGGGIILTASHNPKQWNALKLLNSKGEFISGEDGAKVLKLANGGSVEFAEIDQLGSVKHESNWIQKHIETILALPLVDKDAIAARNFKIVVDSVNSTGSISVTPLLRALGIENIIEINDSLDGKFAHNPEPLPENLGQIAHEVKFHKAHLGIVVDPDVDRLCFVNEDGSFFGEEYTLVAVADYVLSHKSGDTVSNLSSSFALRDVTAKRGGTHHQSAVGEVNVVAKMKEVNAVIGGEGNGGIIYPDLHYGRDALVGIALFLSHLAKFGKPISMLRSTYPDYHISKNKIQLNEGINLDIVLDGLKSKYAKYKVNTIDGVKIEFDNEWVHLRKSNTEPIIRVYAESNSETTSHSLTEKIIKDVGEILRSI